MESAIFPSCRVRTALRTTVFVSLSVCASATEAHCVADMAATMSVARKVY